MHKKLLLCDLGNKNGQPNRLSSGLVCKNVKTQVKSEKFGEVIMRVKQVIDGKSDR